jgi:hypothetical protein
MSFVPKAKTTLTCEAVPPCCIIGMCFLRELSKQKLRYHDVSPYTAILNGMFRVVERTSFL